MKISPLQKVTKVLDGEVDSEFTIIRTVSNLCRFQRFREVCERLPLYCWSTAPTATPEASVMRQVGASWTGWQRSEALARASLMVGNAAVVELDHSKQSEGLLVRLSRSLRGWHTEE